MSGILVDIRAGYANFFGFVRHSEFFRQIFSKFVRDILHDRQIFHSLLGARLAECNKAKRNCPQAGFYLGLKKCPVKIVPKLDCNWQQGNRRGSEWLQGAWMATIALRKDVKTPSKPLIVTQAPSRRIWGKLRHFFRITRPKEGIILKVARPAQTRPNGQIPKQNGGMAGL